jgi:YidC/Oxa1 family membrane protein insertase
VDRQIILAVVLSALVVMAYQEYLRIYYPNLGKSAAPNATPTPVLPLPPLPQGAPAEARAPESKPPPHADLSVATPLIEAEFSSVGGRLVSLRLKHYRTTIDPKSPPLELVAAGENGDAPLGVILRGDTSWDDGELVYTASVPSLALAAGRSGEILLSGQTPQGIAIEKRLRFDAERYGFAVDLKVGADASRHYSEAALRWAHAPSESQSRYSFQGPEALVGGKLVHLSESQLTQGAIFPDPHAPIESAPPVHWAGYADRYFLSAMVPRENEAVRLWVKKERGEISTEILVPIAEAAHGYPFVVYTGPKDLHTLSLVSHYLTRSVDLGWFGFVAEPMLRILKFFHRGTGNYGIDIILLTVLVKLVTIPLTHKSYKSMQELQKLQPQMKKLQEKYADDRTALNKEVMELYRRHNVNPLGGCLPMVVQMPIFIGLYNALLSAVELRHARFALWINDLSAPDRLPPVPRPPFAIIAGTEVRIPVLTLLMGVSMLVQQRMSPQAGDPTQQRMMMIMPLVFTVMFINFPSGLALYWLVNNILMIAQQLIVQRGAK